MNYSRRTANYTNRTNMFFLIGCLNLLVAVVVPSLSSWATFHLGPLSTYTLSLPIMLLPLCILCFLPATVSGSASPEVNLESHEAQPGNSSLGLRTRVVKTISDGVYGAYRYASNHILPILASTRILRALFGVFTVAFSEGAVEVLLQYIHIRFRWSYEDVCSSFSMSAFSSG